MDVGIWDLGVGILHLGVESLSIARFAGIMPLALESTVRRCCEANVSTQTIEAIAHARLSQKDDVKGRAQGFENAPRAGPPSAERIANAFRLEAEVTLRHCEERFIATKQHLHRTAFGAVQVSPSYNEIASQTPSAARNDTRRTS